MPKRKQQSQIVEVMPPTELSIPKWTYDDFLNSDAPYEWLYQFHNDPFKLNRMMEYVKAQASALKIRGFANSQ